MFRKLWKLYFYLFIIASFFDLILRYFWAGAQPDLDSFILIVLIEIIAIIGLYGFVHQKKLLAPFFWKIFFITLIFFFFNGIYSDIKFYANVDQDLYEFSDQIFDLVIVNIVLIPLLVAVYNYAFKFSEFQSLKK